MTREIPLTRGMVALVDDVDYERVMALGSWYAVCASHTSYAARQVPCRCAGYMRQYRLRLHNLILGASGVDHVNGDGLDNRRANLRVATAQQNARNRRPDIGTGFKGVRQLASGRWQARLMIDGKHLRIGTYATPEEAARAYDAAALVHFAEFAYLNFPAEAVTS
jgi:AP2 domain/HNH endonuclease